MHINSIVLLKLWAVHPNIMPPSVLENASAEAAAPRPSRVEYLATVSRHSAAVNVVRFSPNGTCSTRLSTSRD
jgi:chromatin assembly factor 1 subunit B